MKKFIEKIKNLYSSQVTGHSSGEFSINPKRDWNALLISTFALLLIMGVFAYYFYTQIDQGKFFVSTGDSALKEVTIKSDLLKKAIDDIDSRQASLDSIKKNGTNESDPSL